MWILPKKLIQSNGSLAMVETISDLNESSQICASELFVRSKSMQSKTFLRKWKTDSWRLLPYGRIAKPSQHNHSLIESIFLSLPIRANHSQAQENDKEKMTKDTFGRVFICGYEQLDLFAYSSKMSKDTFRWDSPQSSVIWKKQVMKRRGEYSLRVNASMETMKQQHIKESEFLSWPTTNSRDWKDSVNSVPPSVGQTRGYSLGMDVAEKNWGTPTARDSQGQRGAAANARKGNPLDTLPNQMAVYGLPDPENTSTHGSRQGLWQTITAHTPDMESNCPNGHSGTYLAGAVKQWATPMAWDHWMSNNPRKDGRQQQLPNQVSASWATPNNFCFQPPENTEQWTKRAEHQQTEKGVNLHKPIQSQVLHENEKVMGAMPPSSMKLNQRWVETLMGLPLGWTCPLCPPSVIRNWSKFLTGWLKVNHA